jgi:MFS family permease
MKDKLSPLLRPLLLITAMFAAMGGPALAPALPEIKATYHAIPDIEFWTKWLVGISGLFAAIGAPLFGWLSDNWGRRRSLVLALAGWGVFGGSGMIEQPFWMLLMGRAGLGLSLGGLLAANTALIAESFGSMERRRMMGLQSTCTSLGVIFSLIISGWLAELHWHWCFSLYLLALVALPLALLTPTPKASPAPTGERPPSPFVGSFLLITLFALLGMAAFNVIPTQIPFFLKQEGDYAARHLGMALTIMPIVSGITARFYATISRSTGLWNLFLMGGGFLMAGFFAISFSHGSTLSLTGMALVGIGIGISMPHVNVVMATIIPPRSVGRALGFLAGCKFLGLFASPLIMQPVLAASGYRDMFRFAGVLLFLGAVLLAVAGPRFHARDVRNGRCLTDEPTPVHNNPEGV